MKFVIELEESVYDEIFKEAKIAKVSVPSFVEYLISTWGKQKIRERQLLNQMED